MSIITFLLMLVVGGLVIWGVFKALAGQWRDILVAVVVLIVALWILSALGVALPTLPTTR